MPMMKEIWTPFKIMGVRYFKDKDNNVYYKKVGKRHRRQTRPFWRFKRLYALGTLLVVGVSGYIGYQYVINQASNQLFAEVEKEVTPADMNHLLSNTSVQKMLEEQVGKEKAEKILRNYGIATSSSSAVEAGGAKSTSATATTASSAPATKGTEPSTSAPNASQPVKSTAEPAKNSQNVPSKQTTKQTEPKTKPTPSSSLRFKTREEATRFVLSKFSASEINKIRTLMQGGVTADEKAYIKNLVFSRLSKAELDSLKAFSVIELSNRHK
ncbi:hypothetical protein [Priestia koreensis]|uniref:hypothetical protein n=1 Tax=Priestia koreensis TaxID=284581 RepID=UPI001F5A0C10|nr:hypothetical protein [Priestia koreensis]UNL85806.1 hypothetical protein IE339_04645 [Priestia koreensis]